MAAAQISATITAAGQTLGPVYALRGGPIRLTIGTFAGSASLRCKQPGGTSRTIKTYTGATAVAEDFDSLAADFLYDLVFDTLSSGTPLAVFLADELRAA